MLRVVRFQMDPLQCYGCTEGSRDIFIGSIMNNAVRERKKI